MDEVDRIRKAKSKKELLQAHSDMLDEISTLYWDDNMPIEAKDLEMDFDGYMINNVKGVSVRGKVFCQNDYMEAIISKSTRGNGYQLTFFDKEGPVSDVKVKTEQDLIIYVLENNMLPLKQGWNEFID